MQFALLYGISLVLGYRHGLANCIVFNQLGDFYGKDVKLFKSMVKKNSIKLPEGVTKNASPEMFEKMIEMAYKMERPLTNALGENWKNILTKEKIMQLYKNM